MNMIFAETAMATAVSVIKWAMLSCKGARLQELCRKVENNNTITTRHNDECKDTHTELRSKCCALIIVTCCDRVVVFHFTTQLLELAVKSVI